MCFDCVVVVLLAKFGISLGGWLKIRSTSPESAS